MADTRSTYALFATGGEFEVVVARPAKQPVGAPEPVLIFVATGVTVPNSATGSVVIKAMRESATDG